MTLILFAVSSCGKDMLNKNSSNALIHPQEATCNNNSGEICGQPPMPPCAPNAFCAQVMPNPVTYQNDCLMKEAAATFVNAGQCLSISL